MVDHFLKLYASSSLDKCLEVEKKIKNNHELTHEEMMDLKLKEVIEEFLHEISIHQEYDKNLVTRIVKDNSLFHFIEHKTLTEHDEEDQKEKIKKMIEEDFKSGLIDEMEKEILEMEDDDLWGNKWLS